MPELPEVETLRQGLLKTVLKQKICSISTSNKKLRYGMPSKNLISKVSNQTIKDIRRRGKYLIFDLECTWVIIIHLGMSGRLLLLDSDVTKHPHDHVLFNLSSGKKLHFRDPRRFGMFDCLAKGDLEKYKFFSAMGMEPLEDSFSGNKLFELVQKRKKPIKNFIMDGQIVLGVGNIYANEALFDAGISPYRPAFTLSQKEATRLVKSIKKVLRNAISSGGTTINDFAGVDGSSGWFQVSLCVYDQHGNPCPRCKSAKIRRDVLVGRSTFFCPKCQK